VSRERAAYVALALVPGIGSSRLHAILNVCHTATGAFSAPFALLRSIPGMSVAAASAIVAGSVEAGVRAMEQAERLGGRLLLLDDPEYPLLLRHIPDPAPVLFALGDESLLERPAVAIVGSRDHSPYGGEVARALGWAAASAGLTVVSGMARGLDAVAHEAALEAGGGTIGVLGNGLGVVYPAANAGLYRRVAERGLLLTEFPPGERPMPGSFPRRNRLISGLARVTIVVEAAEGSGALITASSALEQGRDVMAVPGSVLSGRNRGSHALLKDGAKVVESADDILDGLAWATSARGSVAPSKLLSTDPLLARMEPGEAYELEVLAAMAGTTGQRLLPRLMELELQGLVGATGGRFSRRQ